MSTNIAAGARVWMHRIALPFFFLLAFSLAACQRYITVVGRGEPTKVNTGASLLVPGEELPALAGVPSGWVYYQLARPVPVDSTGHFSLVFPSAEPMEVLAGWGYGVQSYTVWPGDTLRVGEASQDGESRGDYFSGYPLFVGGAGQTPSSKEVMEVKVPQLPAEQRYQGYHTVARVIREYRKELERLWTDSLARTKGLQKSLYAMERLWGTLQHKADSEFHSVGIFGVQSEAWKRALNRCRALAHAAVWRSSGSSLDVYLYREWAARNVFLSAYAPRGDRYLPWYAEFCYAKAEFEANGKQPRVIPHDRVLRARYVEGYPGVPRALANLVTAGNIGRWATDAEYRKESGVDTADMAWVLEQRRSLGIHGRLDSLANEAFLLHRSAMRRGFLPRGLMGDTATLNGLLRPMPTQNPKSQGGGSAGDDGLKSTSSDMRAVLVWCWNANPAAMRCVGSMAEIAYRLRAAGVRTVSLCFDNNDAEELRESLYQLGLQADYYHTNAAVRAQLLRLLGLATLQESRLLLFSPDGKVLDAALPAPSDAAGVVQAVQAKLAR